MRIIRDIIDFILPRHCTICSCRLLGSEQMVCSSCMSAIHQTRYHEMEHSPMEKMMWGRLPVEKAVAFCYYANKEAKKAVLDNKFHNRPEVGYCLALMYARQLMASSSFFKGIDLIVPVPISGRRRMARGYNQSCSIAKGISEVTGIPVAADVARKVRHTRPQTKLTRGEREENVKDAYMVTKPEKLVGKHVLIVDDVITTGATIMAFGTQLAKVKGVKMSVLTLAHATDRMHPAEGNDDIEFSLYGIPMLENDGS